MTNPYIHCPTYENNDFLLRLVKPEDAKDLLTVYADETASQYFNSDNCTSNFQYKTLKEMSDCIDFWLKEYATQSYVRFAIVSKVSDNAVGTIEIFNRGQLADYANVGMLRIDLCSAYEENVAIASLLNLIHKEIPRDFGLDYLLTKAIPTATERISALTTRGYKPVPDRSLLPYSDYYLKSILESTAENMGYCGLVCELCLEASECSGCKTMHNCCPEHQVEEGCSIFLCCESKGIEGCWACDTAPCEKAIFSGDNHMRNRAFVKFAKEEGVERLVKCVMTNHAKGIVYGYQKDYDQLGTEAEVVALLTKFE